MIDPLTILAIDPSSCATGYAVLRAGRLIEAGVIRPKATAPANDRIRSIAADLIALMDEHRPEVVAVEDTSGKVARRLGKNVSGLAVYGKAVGWIVADAERWAASVFPPSVVELVTENEWTNGEPKAARGRRVAIEYPGYDPAKDPGGDAADAIALAAYVQRVLQMRAAVEAALRK